MFVMYVKGNDEFAVPAVEIGETVEKTAELAKDYVPPKKFAEARRALVSEMKWEDKETGLAITIRGKGKR